MIDRDIGFGAGCRLGVIGHGEPGLGHHQQVVGAIAAGDDLFPGQTQFVGQAGNVLRLGCGIDDVPDDTTSQLATGNFQLVRGGEIETEFDAQALGEIGERNCTTRNAGLPISMAIRWPRAWRIRAISRRQKSATASTPCIATD